MKGLRSWAVLIGVCPLAACAASVPVAVTERGTVSMRGTVTPIDRMTGTSEFLIASDGMSCFGTIPAWKLSASTTFVVRCTDGRNGTASITLASSDTISGSGQIQLNDGQRLDFVFGPNA